MIPQQTFADVTLEPAFTEQQKAATIDMLETLPFYQRRSHQFSPDSRRMIFGIKLYTHPELDAFTKFFYQKMKLITPESKVKIMYQGVVDVRSLK